MKLLIHTVPSLLESERAGGGHAGTKPLHGELGTRTHLPAVVPSRHCTLWVNDKGYGSLSSSLEPTVYQGAEDRASSLLVYIPLVKPHFKHGLISLCKKRSLRAQGVKM